jgi:hypothetical protein
MPRRCYPNALGRPSNASRVAHLHVHAATRCVEIFRVVVGASSMRRRHDHERARRVVLARVCGVNANARATTDDDARDDAFARSARSIRRRREWVIYAY